MFRRCLSIVAVWLACGAPGAFAGEPPTNGLLLWLDAADVDADDDPANNPSGETLLDAWMDKSGQGNHLVQDSVDHQPAYRLNSFGSKPAVRFGGKDMLDCGSFRGFATGDRPFHAVVLMRASGESAHPSQRIFDLSSRDPGQARPADRHGFWVGYQSNRKRVRLGVTNGDEGESQAVAWDGKPNLIEVVYSGAQNFALFFNGRKDVRAMFGGTYFLGFKDQVSFALGQHFGLEEHKPTFLEGEIAEVLVYGRPLSTVERHEIGTYLTEKYLLNTDFRELPLFEKDIRPILARHCDDCHGAESQEAGLDLRSVSSMLRGGEAGPVIVRGFSEYSELVAMVESGKMPPDPDERLTDDEIRTVRRWIDADAPGRAPIVAVSLANKITDEDRRHWAYQALVAHRPPEVKHADRVRGPIDRFVLQRLEQHGLGLSPEARAETLIRRAYFDLVGLPPSPGEIDAFVADPRPDAYERLVDRLLGSKHFGERWGRHWLDVAGYVEVYGSDNDADIIKTLEGKWRYRDYVIRSFNDDKPMDQFIVEQLAGDELFDWRSAETFTPEIVEALTATGFLLCANDDTDSNELNTPDVRHHVLQRTAEVVAGNLLALTLHCAKCHDHKYEAISQEDYYRFEAVFAPAFNVRHWVQSTGHGRPNVSSAVRAEIDRRNAEITSKIEELEARQQGIREPYRRTVFEQRLAKVPESIRETVRSAFETPADQRDDKQKERVAKHEAMLLVDPQEVEALLRADERESLSDLARQIAELNSQRRSYGTVQIVYEVAPPPATHVLRRGNYLRPGLEVEPGLPSILETTPASDTTALVWLGDASSRARSPLGPTSGRRLALARQMTGPDSTAGQHVARVMVNRLWQHVFGKGIVETSDNFGVSGSAPSHPQLLDWLTFDFIRKGWRIKPIIKSMMMSSVYRQTSALGNESERMERVDPDSQLLWRMRLRRMESELVRDAILTSSGKLDRTMGGPSIPLEPRPDGMVVIKENELPTPTAKWRRSVYILARRNYHLTMMRVFDQPIVARNCTVRKPAPAVTQALAMLHDDFVNEQAEYFAQRVANSSEDPRQRINAAFRISLGRLPDDDEMTWCVDLMKRHEERYRQSSASEDECRQKALVHLCHMLLNTNEFLYVQ